MTESLNRDMYDQLVRGIAEARKKTEAEVRALLDQGPFAPEDALRADSWTTSPTKISSTIGCRRCASARDEMRRVEGSDYQRDTSALARHPAALADRRALRRRAPSCPGKSGFDPLNGDVVGSDTMVEQIRRIRDDDSIKAIVLRVDSPGGSAVASDVIWRELMITRDQKPSRPLIASMSDLAASGGYYIAMPAQVIVAQPATLTGSIGIFAGKIALGGRPSKIGVTPRR